LEVVLNLKKRGLADYTIEGYSRRLRFIAKNTDINDPETVKEYISNKQSSNANKEAYANAYDHFVKFHGFNWKKPFFIREERLPNVPTTEQVNTIIPTFTRKYTTIFSILWDTGLRPVELHRLRLKNINLENGTITPKTAKNGAARILKLPDPTLAMLKGYLTKYHLKQTDVLFPPTKKQCHIWVLRHNQLAEKLNQPELTKYRLYDLRHYFATMLYAKTKYGITSNASFTMKTVRKSARNYPPSLQKQAKQLDIDVFRSEELKGE
jgi:integrase